MGCRRFPGGETIREIYASSYGESHGVRVQIIEIRIGPRGLAEGGTIRGSHAGLYKIKHAKCVERHRNTHGPPRVFRRGDISGIPCGIL